MKRTIVIDLDGTLSDCTARRYLVEGKHRDYEAFHARLHEDPPNEWCLSLLKSMADAGHAIILVSARPKSAELETRLWLEKHQVPYQSLRLLREDGDSTPDQVLKMAWADAYGPEHILFVVDDRSKVVDAWRSKGITVLHCAPYDVDSIVSGKVREARAEIWRETHEARTNLSEVAAQIAKERDTLLDWLGCKSPDRPRPQ